MRLTRKDKQAIIDALNFVLAGDYDDDAHDVSQDEMTATLDKVAMAWRDVFRVEQA